MFGLDKITWGEFLTYSIFILATWYIVVLVRVWHKCRGQPTRPYEETAGQGTAQLNSIKPVTVASADFPSTIEVPTPSKPEPLQVRRYEETIPDEGIGLAYMTDDTEGKLQEVLPEIQYRIK